MSSLGEIVVAMMAAGLALGLSVAIGMLLAT
jgi:hypothetical protein